MNIYKEYFSAWNAHDLTKLSTLFDEDILLQDWEVCGRGLLEVTKINQETFIDNPRIMVNIMSEAYGHELGIFELKVLLGFGEHLNVVDVIKIKNNKICQISAYKR
jgi:hypothetical protein